MIRPITTTRIAVSLATYKRPILLEDLLISLCRMEIPLRTEVELRIVDNDQRASAKKIVDKLKFVKHPFVGIRYTIAGEQNIAIARNTGIEMGSADVVVFIDDDERVERSWLMELWKSYYRNSADAVFAPVHGTLEKEYSPWIRAGEFFEKKLPPSDTRIGWKQTRTSNTLVDGKWFYGQEKIRFDPNLGRSGGSDTELFSRMEDLGAIFVSCGEAAVSEKVPASRACLKWLFKRRYRNGLIYERIVAGKKNELKPLKRFFRRVCAGVLHCVAGIPKSALGDHSRFLKGVLCFPLAFGGIVEWIRPNAVNKHVFYRNKKAHHKCASKDNCRVAFLTNIVSPYRLPIFKKLATTPGWDFKIFQNSKSEFDRSWDVDDSELPIKKTATVSWKRKVKSSFPINFEQVLTLHFPIGLFSDLFKFKPSVVISLELGFRSALAAIYCATFGVPLVIWAYQSKVSAEQGKWRGFLRRWLISRSTYIIGMGTQARDVLVSWGASNEIIVDAPNAANHVTLLDCLNEEQSQEQIYRIRKTVAGFKKMAIVVGRLIPLKGIEQLVESWKQLPEYTRDSWNLVFVGEGPMDTYIKESACSSIVLAGAVSTDRMANWYAAADLHIFPSCGDVWGLVVNEASTCGTPTLCSVYAGCCDDVIDDGKNGLTIDFIKSSEAVVTLQSALERNDLNELGSAAKEKIKYFTQDRLAASFSSTVGNLTE